MKTPKLYKWKYNNNLKGLLLFSQKLEELLFLHTIDAYRASALNTHTRLLEFINLCNDYTESKITLNSLLPFKEELINSFRNDPVLLNNMPSIYVLYQHKLEDYIKKPQKKKMLMMICCF